MKALYYESKNREPWENERLEFDQIEYEIKNEEDVIEHKLGVLLNEGENSKTLDDYKNSMLQKLKLKNEIPLASSWIKRLNGSLKLSMNFIEILDGM